MNKPANPLDGSDLSERQRDILDFIVDSVHKRGFPPSVREIGKAIGLTSPSTVHSHLSTLVERGYLRRDATKPRAIEVRWDKEVGAMEDRPQVRNLPVYGSIAAGPVSLAAQEHEGVLPVPAEFVSDVPHFVLKVKGESMKDAGILDGDMVVVRVQPDASTGDIVAAQITGPTGESEATVKRFRRQGRRILLIPENEAMAPIEAPEDLQILGRAVALLRKF